MTAGSFPRRYFLKIVIVAAEEYKRPPPEQGGFFTDPLTGEGGRITANRQEEQGQQTAIAEEGIDIIDKCGKTDQ